MTINNLIDFIDRQTNSDAIYLNEAEGIGIEEGAAFIRSFSPRDWLALHNLNLKEKSDAWIKCLIDLLDGAYTEEARQMIIHIALTSREEIFFEAMKYIRGFRRNVSTYTWLKLENRATEISSQRIKNRFNNY